MLGFFGCEIGAVEGDDIFELFDQLAPRFDAFGDGVFGAGEVFDNGGEAGGVDWGCWGGFCGVGEFGVFFFGFGDGALGCCFCFGDGNLEGDERLDFGGR